MSCNVNPVGRNILIKPTPPKETEGTIIRLEETKDADQRAATTGTILAIGDLAWDDFPDSKHWAKVGQVVIFKAHTGMRVKNKEDDKEFLLLMRDLDIAATMKGES